MTVFKHGRQIVNCVKVPLHITADQWAAESQETARANHDMLLTFATFRKSYDFFLIIALQTARITKTPQGRNSVFDRGGITYMDDCQIAVVSNRRGFFISEFAEQLETNNVESEPNVQLQG